MMRWKGWEKVRIERECQAGNVSGIAPVIVSASRSTDIPAFYGPWFMDRLEKGYAKWVNPFNHHPQYVSFEKTRLFVFWSKNPAPFLHQLERIGEMGYSYYVLFTLNDYETEKLEPNIPSLERRMDTFGEVSDRIGRGRVIWRFDPLVLSDSLTPDILLDRIEHIGEILHKKTLRLIISFVDIEKYARVKRNLSSSFCPDAREFSIPEMERLAAGLESLNRRWGLDISTCGETRDLSGFGIRGGQCIGYDYITGEFGQDEELMRFLRPAPDTDREMMIRSLKDPGQRGQCGCIVSKDIGQYNTCMHLCSYCYANASSLQARKNYARYINKSRESGFGEAILD
jgi:hypothetical protein